MVNGDANFIATNRHGGKLPIGWGSAEVAANSANFGQMFLKVGRIRPNSADVVQLQAMLSDVGQIWVDFAHVGLGLTSTEARP